MWIKRFFVSAIMGIVWTTSQTAGENPRMLFDFTTLSNVGNWIESSDTVRDVGMSKAVLALQKTQKFQRAVFFTLLNPQENGAGFAGMRTPVYLNLTGYSSLKMTCRAQGANEHYKIILRHRGMTEDETAYEQFFTVPTSDPDFGVVNLDLIDFKPYYRGRIQPDEEPLDTSDITMFGIQIYGGVYSPFKQKGVSSLEIKTIEATL